MKLWAVILALAIGMALLPEFRDKSEITNRVVVTAVGIDKGEDGGCHLSVQAIETMKTSGSLSEQQDNATQVYEIDGQSVAGAMQTFATDTGRDTYILHNRVIALGMETVRSRTLPSLLDYFMRNHESRPMVNLVICRGKASGLLNTPSSSYPIPAEQITKLLQEGRRWGTVVGSSLLDTERALSGMADALLPIVNVEGEGEDASVSMDGTAVFRNGVLVGELDENGTRGLLFAQNDIEQCLYVLKMDDGRSVTVEVHKSGTKMSVRKKGAAAEFTFQVTCKAEITEDYGDGTLNGAQTEELCWKIEQAVIADMHAALDTTINQLGCDVLGLGRMVKKKLPALIRGKEEQWPEKLKACDFSLHVDAQIDRSGMTSGEHPKPAA